ncbi:MAG: malectin domain-containing carbohydrate-binding protein [Bryobacteraceae bacterium]
MEKIDRSPQTEQERSELEATVERLARSPRLAGLLRYIGQKYLDGETAEISEYSIATEVFGRPRTFDAGQDAIARVEIHRLRRKLKQYYESEGKDCPVQISIPLGTQIPLFIHNNGAAAAPPDADSGGPGNGHRAGVIQASESKRLPRVWWYGAAIAVMAILGLGFLRAHRAPSAASSTHPSPAADMPAGAPIQQSGTVRLLAGYSGQPHIDGSGAVWGPDKYFNGGGPWVSTQTFTARTNDPFLFQTLRTGEFSYDIPLRPGVYELHMFFVEPSYGPGLGGGELSRVFAININGARALSGFDIESDAMGADIADERVWKDIQPASDGKLHIAVESQIGKPILNAIEVLPGIPHKQLPIRLIAQPNSFIDHAGQLWSPDNYYLGGQDSVRRPAVADTADPGIYAMERFGHFSYAMPVDTRSLYTVVLHFAEFYFGPGESGGGGVGSRRFNAICNGVMLLDNFDIFKEVGSLHALTKTFRHLKPSPQGKLNLTFEPIANYANVTAIEVMDESR